MSVQRPFAWPTLAVAAAVYGGFLLVTWFHAALPGWLLAVLGGYLTAWQASLQHETVHGHPFRQRWANWLLGLPGFLLWLPWGVYRDTHLRHHVDSRLTDPLEDPESFYVTPAVWARLGRLRRAWLWGLNTLAGRLLLGPARTVAVFLGAEARLLAAGDRRRLRHWLWHLPGLALVGLWVFWICGIPAWLYLLAFVYPGTALMLLRSFLEHRAAEAVGARSAVVEAGPLLSLLYLNNNLHAVHHGAPALPWYALPRAYRSRRAAVLAGNGDYRYPGYLGIAAAYLFKAKEPPVHPLQADAPPDVRHLDAGAPVAARTGAESPATG